MIRISQLKIPCGAKSGALESKIRKLLRLADTKPFTLRILRHSVDVRKKPDLYDVYTVGVSLSGQAEEKKLVSKLGRREIVFEEPVRYVFPAPAPGTPPLMHRPVIAGFGPAGIFCALMLARCGYRPIVLERGPSLEDRTAAVGHFWKTGHLNPEANIQFGEGGAGTYSDGKLNTGVRDRSGRNGEVLRTFVQAGAPEEILTEQHPHIGTDILRQVVRTLREEILRLGGEIQFSSLLTDILLENGALTGIRVTETSGLTAGDSCGDAGRSYVIPADALVLAPGHSARDTIRMLHAKGIAMTQKNFAVGFRVSHPQEIVDRRNYGFSDPDKMNRLHLEPSSYKLTAQASSGRGVYSFCMCPGGWIVNASSEEGRLAVNGMSDFARDTKRANSAIIMTVGSSDFGGEGVLDGMHFQERLEEKAYRLAGGRIPVQPFGSFEKEFYGAEDSREAMPLKEKEAEALCLKGLSALAPLHTLLGEDLTKDFIEGMHTFEHTLPGFTGPDAWVAGLESRTSSPVRILRDETLQSSVRGLFPCGEGAGYAGGIMSAAIDGIRAAEAVVSAGSPHVSVTARPCESEH